jgi:hypothetical protein
MTNLHLRHGPFPFFRGHRGQIYLGIEGWMGHTQDTDVQAIQETLDCAEALAALAVISSLRNGSK